jgi:hypothetical protein
VVELKLRCFWVSLNVVVVYDNEEKIVTRGDV